MTRTRTPERFAADFWARVGKDRLDPSACWPYMGFRDVHGYGIVRITRRTEEYAHRVAMKLSGSDPSGSHVRHNCDNPPCCNPAHLALGTHLDNMRDKVAHGRAALGEKLSHLTTAQVVEMRERRARGETITSIASRFQITTPATSRICTGVTWRHVGGPISEPRPMIKRAS